MPPGWLASLDDYAVWLEGVVFNSGGVLLDAMFLTVEWLVDAAGQEVGLNVERQRLSFPNGNVLAFDLLLDRNLESEEYHFDYRGSPPASELIWRLDKHPGHPAVGACHLHYLNQDGVEQRAAATETDLGEVIQRIHDCWSPPRQ